MTSGLMTNLFTHFYTPPSVRFHQERYDSNRFLNIPAWIACLRHRVGFLHSG